MLPSSEACERNKGPILGILREAFTNRSRVLEIGSGTGQHAVHFARHLSQLFWQPTDRAEYLDDLVRRIETEGTANLGRPVELDVLQRPWPALSADAMFSANTLHIMSWQAVEALFAGLPRVLDSNAVLAIYGPFRYSGRFTTQSNAEFDRGLRARDPSSGVRDFEAVDSLASRIGFELVMDHAMPANNQLIVWRRG
jgi:SAM-dependent methyltransferase